MNKEVFTWKMSAEAHKSSVYELRKVIVEHYQEQKPLELLTILSLVPLFTEDVQLIADRGFFEFAGDAFTNSGDSHLLTFYDNVIGNYYVTLPKDWTGEIKVSGDNIEINFTSEVMIEIPELANLGVDRSAFQKLISIKSTLETTISILIDNDSDEKETWIDAVLIPEAATAIHYPQYELASFEKFDTSTNGCGPDENDPSWYVYQRIQGGDVLGCLIHHGIIVGGSIAYVQRFGPGTFSACKAYMDQNCPTSSDIK